MQAPPGSGKEISKSIKVIEKVILAGDSIVSGVNGKDLSTDRFTIILRDIPGATSDDMVRGNQAPFMTKELSKTILTRSRIKNKYNK